MSEVKITVGITAFNCHKYLNDAINSVLDQNTDHWSGIIILDGGADKQTRQIFQEFDNPKFQKYVFKENQGPYGARSKAIELSNTEWYCQLDGDDLLTKNAIKLILETIKTNPDAEFIYGNCEHFSERSSEIKTPIKDPKTLYVYYETSMVGVNSHRMLIVRDFQNKIIYRAKVINIDKAELVAPFVYF